MEYRWIAGEQHDIRWSTVLMEKLPNEFLSMGRKWECFG